MVRERTVQRRLGARGLTAIALLAAVALPLGAKFARADDPALEPTRPASTPRAANDPTAAAPGAAAIAKNEPFDATSAAGEPQTALPGSNQKLEERLQQSAHDAKEQQIAKLQAELDAATRNVDRLRQQIEDLKGWQRSDAANSPVGSPGAAQPAASATAAPRGAGHTASSSAVGAARARGRRATLGHINFTYQEAGSASAGTLLAYDGLTKKLMWKLDIPLNADSVIQCYDNENLLVKSADGYTRLVTAEDGQVIWSWAPGVRAPDPAPHGGVNPFGGLSDPNSQGRRSASDATATVATSTARQDPEQRLDRIEDQIRQLTEAVNRLTRDQEEKHRSSPGPAGR
jgi:hypothetical protein